MEPVKPRCMKREKVPRLRDSRAAARRHRDTDTESEQRGHRAVAEGENERTVSIFRASKKETKGEYDKADHDPNRGKKEDTSEHLVRRCANPGKARVETPKHLDRLDGEAEQRQSYEARAPDAAAPAGQARTGRDEGEGQEKDPESAIERRRLFEMAFRLYEDAVSRHRGEANRREPEPEKTREKECTFSFEQRPHFAHRDPPPFLAHASPKTAVVSFCFQNEFRMTLYETLGVEPYASQREIKRAYRRLALRYHPDRNPDNPDAEELFKEIVSANMVLSDRRKRAAYDERIRPSASAAPSDETYTAPGQWTPPPPRREDWPDLEKDLRGVRWRDFNTLDARDAWLGILAAVSCTMALNETGQATGSLQVAFATFAGGYSVSWPLQKLHGSRMLFLRVAGAWLAPPAAAAAAIATGMIVTGQSPDLLGGSGLPFALVGGLAGGFLGASVGRAFRLGPLSGLVAGGIAGAISGGLIAAFMWYWGSVFRYVELPVRDDLSILAFVGVIGSMMGSAFAAAIGSTRD